ncbi:replication initiation protein [Helicobacter pullorum]|uniref:replication initiation protein n=1 Tax=Helicobacter pullorum TaxID=35818 RepID=UPI000761BD9B|nr:replication initiation protein [Helicobacter pullorum]
MEKKKKTIKQKTKKAVVTQNNRFIYAKYDMNANELKFFMWIVAQINSQKDQLFQVCEIPLSEIFQVWQWENNRIDYSYCFQIVESMARKAYIEDFKLLDEKTMKEVSVKRAMPLFKFIEYKEGQGYITYQLNDCLMQYLLDQKRDFTQLKFSDIQQMKSAYSIRIYNMLICELKQNRQSLKINLSVLQNILEVPKIFQEYKHFNQKILTQAKKDINTKSNIVLLDIKTFKTGRKITDLEFIFDYKSNDTRIQRDEDKHRNFIKRLIEIVESYLGKSIHDSRYGDMIIISYDYQEDTKKLYVTAERKSDKKLFKYLTKDFKDIDALQKAKEKAEELFYLDSEIVKNSKRVQGVLSDLLKK